MDYSIFFIKFYGYFIFLFAGSLLISKDGRQVIITQSKENIMLTGMISLIIGLPVIILHNIWKADVSGLVTFIGWMSTLKGV